MPRTRPDRTEEVRISLSNKEREFIAEQIKINQNKTWLGPLIGNFGTVVIGTGVVIGGYALWKWVGGFSPIDTIKDTVQGWVLGVGGGLYKVVAGESVEDTVQRWQDVYNAKIEEINEKCAERLKLPKAILNDPNSSENQKAQAQREITQIQMTCDKARQSESRRHYAEFTYLMESMQGVQHGMLRGLPIIGPYFGSSQPSRQPGTATGEPTYAEQVWNLLTKTRPKK